MLTACIGAFAITGCGSSGSSGASGAAGGTQSTASESADGGEQGGGQTTADSGASDAAESGSASAGTTFIVGFDQDFPPMGFKDEDGNFTGFDLDLASEAASRMGLSVVYQPIAWDSKDAELDAGTIDCIWNGFTVSGREDQYTWSDPYMDNSQVFVVREDSGIKSTADLAGKTIEVQADSSAEAALNEEENASLTSTFGTLQATPDYDTALMDLEMGAVDAIAMDSTVADYKITSGGMKLIVLDEPFASEKYAVGFKLGNTELRDKVNDTLKEMAADGTLAKISEKWFGEDVTIIK